MGTWDRPAVTTAEAPAAEVATMIFSFSLSLDGVGWAASSLTASTASRTSSTPTTPSSSSSTAETLARMLARSSPLTVCVTCIVLPDPVCTPPTVLLWTFVVFVVCWTCPVSNR